jgi:hypothetical protein
MRLPMRSRVERETGPGGGREPDPALGRRLLNWNFRFGLLNIQFAYLRDPPTLKRLSVLKVSAVEA